VEKGGLKLKAFDKIIFCHPLVNNHLNIRI
jgi:hypothetical protein